MRSAARILLAVLAVASVIAAVWGSVEVRRHVGSQPRYSIEDWQVGLSELPDWVTPEIQSQVESTDLSGVGLTLFNRGVLDVVRERFETNAWVERVESVDVVYPTAQKKGALLLEVELRRPAALVDVEGSFYLIDAEGRRVGDAYADAPTDWFGVPAITHASATAARVPPAGEHWSDYDVLSGLAVAKILSEHGFLGRFLDHPIERIDVGNVDGRRDPSRSEVALYWQGCRVAWGRSPLSIAPRTIGDDRVLQHLRYIVARPERFGEYAEIHLHRLEMTGVRRQPRRTFDTSEDGGNTAAPVPSSGPLHSLGEPR